MDEKLLAVLIPSAISSLTAILVIVITRIVSNRQVSAKATADEGDAAESLSTASKTLVETYNKELIIPMQKRIDDLIQQLSVMEEDRHTEKVRFQNDIKVLQNQVTELLHQINFMKGELRRSDSALEFILSITKDTHPVESEKALRIRRGEL